MVTVAEIARNIGIPATTAREYVGRFKQFFPTKKVSGKRYPMHPNSAENVMRDIVESYGRSMTTDEVMNLLKEKHPISADVIDEEEQTPSSNQHSPVQTDNSTVEILTRMNNMQMQLMQQMTNVLDRNNQVMERIIKVLDRDSIQPALNAPEQKSIAAESGIGASSPQEREEPVHTAEQPRVQETIPQEETKPAFEATHIQPPVPKKFIMPSKEELEKRRNKSWLSRMFGA